MKRKRVPVIPKSTEILSRKISIKWNTERIREKGLYGSINMTTGELHLADNIYGVKVPVEEIEMTYWHEIFHFVLNKNGYEQKLSKAGIDLEDIVEDLAVGTYQAITKAKYD